MRRFVMAIALVSALVPVGLETATPAAGAPAVAVTVEPVAFPVQNPLNGEVATIRGSLYRPAAAPSCSSSVMVLLHGTAGGAFVWDLSTRPQYSPARALAAAGYPALAIDELGYAGSDHPDGYTLTIPSHAAFTSQIADQLRAGSYQAPSSAPSRFAHVGLVGHSAGAEIAELTAGSFGGIDLLVVLGYTHFLRDDVGRVFVAEEQPRALEDDYVYLWGTPERVHKYHHNVDYIEPEVLATVDGLTTLTPSGLILTIGSQLSRDVMATIRVPVLLVMSEADYIFPIEHADKELALFAGTSDKTIQRVPLAGHTFFLEPNAPATNAEVVDWLRQHPTQLPAC